MSALLQFPIKKHCLKLESLDISVARAGAIVSEFRDFLESLGYSSDRISELECRLRDGFYPYSHNKGGLGGDCYVSHTTMIGGGHGGYFKKTTKVLEASEAYDLKCFLESKNLEEMDYENDELVSEWDNARYESDDTVLIHTKLMLNSESQLTVTFEICASDSPYHRKADESLSKVIKFKTIKELKSKLNKLHKLIFVNQMKLLIREGW